MNTLKPLLIFAVLVGVCYGIYSRINHKSDNAPPEAAGGWEGSPMVEKGDVAGGPGALSMAGIGSSHSADGGHAAPLMAIPGGSGSDPNAHSYDPRGQNMPPAGAPGGWNAAPPAAAGGAGVDYTVGGDPNYGAPSYNPQAGNPGAGADPAANFAPPTDPYADPGAPGRYGDPAGSRAAAGSSAFLAAFDQAKRELEAGRLAEAHYLLSRWYDDPSLTPPELQQLTELLDQLAGTVIYSTQNLIEPACEVQPGESLERIAQRYNVPWQLLAKINGIEDPHSLRPGERLKVVRGPFNAVVSLDKCTLTLYLNSTYAGRFPVGLGREHPPREGQYVITDKVTDPTYYGPGRTIERGDPGNPLGRRWLGLGNQMGIHGTNEPRPAGRTDLGGSISLSERDVEDVFDILSEGSKVMIRR